MSGRTPWVGEATDEYRAVCVYSDRPGSPRCNEPATVHVKVGDATYGCVALASCDSHAPIARASGMFVEEHAYEGFCGLVGTLWIDNHCVLDDSGRSLAQDAAAVSPMTVRG